MAGVSTQVNPPEHRRFMTSGHKAPADARAFVRERFSDRSLCDDLVLMVSELVTNAVRHGPRRGRVFLRMIDGRELLRVEVKQLSANVATLNGSRQDGSGFGLQIVEALSDSWGTGDPEWAGVWFEMRSEVD